MPRNGFGELFGLAGLTEIKPEGDGEA